MKNSKLVNKITNAYVMLIYVFVFIPVIVMIAFSFNSLPSNQHWESFTLDYYSKLFDDSSMILVLINSLAPVFYTDLTLPTHYLINISDDSSSITNTVD